MAKIKYNPYNDDDGLSKELLDAEGAKWRQIIDIPQDKPIAPAKSQWATGRACPKDAGQLTFFQYDEKNDIIVLQCKSCGSIYYKEDLDPHQFHIADGVQDNINFRNIPADVVQRWMDARENEKKRNGEWT